jgi:hypothetical protein
MTAGKKEVDFSVRPGRAKEALPANPSLWVNKGTPAQAGPLKRLTLNLPVDMHTAFKGRCVIEGVTIQDKVNTLIDAYLAAVNGQGKAAKAD